MTVRRRTQTLMVALAVLAAAGATAAQGLTTPSLPPVLRRLLAAEQRLRPRRFLVDQSVTESRDGHEVLVSRLVERGRLAPARYALTTADAGTTVFLRSVGSYAYGSTHRLPRVDGGHRWVRVHLTNLAGGEGNVVSLIRQYLSNLARVVVPSATSIQPLGATQLGGQPVSAFTISTANPPVSTTLVYLAPTGLPVRTVETVGAQVTTTDMSVTTPVVVHRPPVDETIDESRLSPAAQRRVNRLLAAPPGLQ